MLHGSSFSQPGEYILPLLYVGLPGEVGKVLIPLRQPGLGGLEAKHALVTPAHRHIFIGKID